MEYNEPMMGEPCDNEGRRAMQAYSDDSAVMAQVHLLELFGVHLNQARAVYECASHGWYTPGGGTHPCNAGNLMELHGVSVHAVQNATVADLAEELLRGRGVIVGVHSAEQWDQGLLAEFKDWLCKVFCLDNATFTPSAHAVVVEGIDVSDPGAPMVVVNDSGSPDGQGCPYPLDKFMDAWEDGRFSYTASDAAIPQDSGAIGCPGMLDMGKWLADGPAADSATIATVGILMAGTGAEFPAGSAVESLFSDPSVIYSI